MVAPKDKNPNRRKHSRLPHRITARFEAGQESGEGMILNVSEGGLFLQCALHFPHGELISLEIGTETKIALVGKVAWAQKEVATALGSTPGGIGIELFAVPNEYLEFVRSLRLARAEREPREEDRFEMFHHVRFDSGDAFLSEYSENLSRGGMFLSTDKPVPIGSEVKVRLEIPGLPEPAMVKGKVAYKLSAEEAAQHGRIPGVGVQFVALDAKAKDHLRHYLGRLDIHRRRPERRQTERTPSSGSLQDYLVPELLLGLRHRMATGILVLKRQGVKKLIYLRGGFPVYVESSLPAETLSRYMLRHGMISKKDLDQSLKELANSKLRHGELLVRSGRIDPSKLASALVGHQEEKLSNTFAWFDGDFKFDVDTKWPASISVHPLQLYRIVFEGIQRWYDSTLVVAWMGLQEDILLHATRSSLPPGVPEDVSFIIKESQKATPIREIAQRLQKDSTSILSTIFALVIANWAQLEFPLLGKEAIVEEKPKTPPPQTEPPPGPSPAALATLRKDVEKELKERSSVDDYYLMLGAKEGMSIEELDQCFSRKSAPFTQIPVDQIPDADLRSQVIETMSWLRMAHETLRDPELKKVYEERETGRKPQEAVTNRIDRERSLLKAIQEIDKKEYQKAAEILTTALKEHSQDRLLDGYLAWTLFQKDRDGQLETSVATLDRALEHHSEDANLWYFRGEAYSYINNWKSAHWCFGQACSLDPESERFASVYIKAKERAAVG